uniref:Acid sensing ion channel subunit family member 5 n=1 Tax=Latimeria chalumnae TaxID=7897 RepID=H3A4U7_LATCH
NTLQKIQICLLHSLPPVEERKKYDCEFATSTSFHGLHNAVGQQPRIRKVVWMLVVLSSFCVFIWQVSSRFINYFSWPTTTTVVLQYVEDIEFPAVTFCNLNRYQTQAVTNLTIVFYLWSIVSAFIRFTGIDGSINVSQEPLDFVLGNPNFSIKDFTRSSGYLLNNSTLLKCDFYGEPCYPEDFEHVFTEYGNCYTFNHNDIVVKRRVSVSGRGLSLLLDIKQIKKWETPCLGIQNRKISMITQINKNAPPQDSLKVKSPSFQHCCIIISSSSTVSQEYPWGECNPKIRLLYHDTYTAYGCLQECKSKQIQDKCGCIPPLLPGNGTECNLEQFYNCAYPTLFNVEKYGLCTAGIHNSTCPAPCEETSYPTTVSYSTFPSNKALQYLSFKLKKRSEYIRQNLVYIDVAYQDLNYKMTQQQKALTATELLADIGGQLGLFCGASVITIIEVLEYLITKSYWMCLALLLSAPRAHQSSS